ncbi:MAG: tetratricopeptide repeat protein [Verrucomicrobiia bacterium]
MMKRRNDPPDESTITPMPGTPGRSDQPWLWAVLLVVLTFLAYQRVWHAGFIWDDDDHLTANPTMTAPDGLRMIWSSLTFSRYYPLTLTTFWFERRVWGLNPMSYHVVNVAIQAINGILVFLILRRLRAPGAWLAACLWVLHPVNVESVAWITELKNVQSGFFFFLSLLCFLRFDAERNRRWYALALVCGLAAMLSKPSTVVLPLVLLLCVWWERGGWQRRDIVRATPFFGLACGMSALTILEQHGQVLRAGTAQWNLGMAGRLIIAGKATWFYAMKILWPAHLLFVYPHWKADVRSPLSWAPLAALAVAGVILGRFRRRPWCRAAWFGCGFFIVALLPVLGFFDVYYFRYSYVADHFQYLASVGLIALAASGGTLVCERIGRGADRAGAVVGAVLVLVLSALTWQQTGIYRNAETLWRDTLSKNPDCWLAHNNLGLVLEHRDRVAEAEAQYRLALQLFPDDVKAHVNLGNALVRQGKPSEAAQQYEEALRIQPDDARARINLGNVWLLQGNLSAAIGDYETALRIDPHSVEAHLNFGVALEQAGRVSEAIEQYEQALRLNPDLTAARNALARLRPGQ